MSKEYVLLLCVRYESSEYSEPQMLVIVKDRPEWQRGRWNLPGGRIEEGETPEQAASRELMEEAGLKAHYVRKMGVMKDREFTIHCLMGSAWPDGPIKPRAGETEVVFWASCEMAMRDKRLIPNLRAIVPLMRCGISDWVIEDNGGSEFTKRHHEFSIAVPTYN